MPLNILITLCMIYYTNTITVFSIRLQNFYLKLHFVRIVFRILDLEREKRALNVLLVEKMFYMTGAR